MDLAKAAHLRADFPCMVGRYIFHSVRIRHLDPRSAALLALAAIDFFALPAFSAKWQRGEPLFTLFFDLTDTTGKRFVSAAAHNRKMFRHLFSVAEDAGVDGVYLTAGERPS